MCSHSIQPRFHSPQGHHGRSRHTSRTVHITPSSVGNVGSYTHLNGHAESGSKRSSPGNFTLDSKKRLQPIGADAKPKISERLMNGVVKRTSLIVDGTASLKGSQTVVTRQSSFEDSCKQNSSASITPADQATTGNSLHTQQKFLPPIV